MCGDGVVDRSEVCDDGDDDPDDGCNVACERTAVVEWTYTYDGANSGQDYAEAVAIDPAGRVIIVGTEHWARCFLHDPGAS
jgi:cysteine-rich repeat protein